MPILEVDEHYDAMEEIQQPKDEDTKPYRTQEEMKTSTIFHKEKPLDTIIQYIRGMKWEIDYFLQVKDVNDTLALPDVNTPATIQKYHRVNKLVMTLQSAITQDNIENITGDAIINAGFLPNKHDVFITTLTGGREAMFSITEVQTRTYNLHQAYYVNFKLHCFLDTEPKLYNDLINKVMKEYVYDKDHLLDYSAPVILQQDYKTKIELKDCIPELTEYWFLNFVNYEKNVMAIPTNNNIYVDTMLNDFIFKIVNRTDSNLISNITNFHLDMYKNIPCSIWDVIINRDIRMLRRVERNIGFKYTPFTYDNLITKKMNALGISFIANKLNPGEQPAIMDIKDISIPKDELNYKAPFGNNRKYVLSEEFYNQSGEYSGLLEKLLVDYLHSRIINTEELNTLIDQYPTWDTFDQYYGIPILMVLIKEAYSRTFKSI